MQNILIVLLVLIVSRAPGVSRSTGLAREAKVSKRAGAFFHCSCLLLTTLVFHLVHIFPVKSEKRAQRK